MTMVLQKDKQRGRQTHIEKGIGLLDRVGVETESERHAERIHKLVEIGRFAHVLCFGRVQNKTTSGQTCGVIEYSLQGSQFGRRYESDILSARLKKRYDFTGKRHCDEFIPGTWQTATSSSRSSGRPPSTRRCGTMNPPNRGRDASARGGRSG